MADAELEHAAQAVLADEVVEDAAIGQVGVRVVAHDSVDFLDRGRRRGGAHIDSDPASNSRIAGATWVD